MFDAADPSPQYELAWPRELFMAEAAALPEPSHPNWLEDAELLLEEAFIFNAPKDDLRTTQWYELPPGLLKDRSSASPQKVARAFVAHLVDSADKLPERSARRPYWSVRSAAQPTSTPPDANDRIQQLHREWTQLVDDLQDRGYLDWFAPRGCAARPASSPAVEVLAAEIEQRLRVDGLWPLRHQDWDSDTFYGLIEVVHDLVARPRHRDQHAFDGCSGHYSNFARIPAQVLYRRDVDRLLDRYGVGLRLAGGGEDMGRLVRAAGDDRDELVEQALQTPNPSDRNAVRHAIALFRSRGVDREIKRSAVLALHRVLEDRRPLIKTELMRKDEGALFQIANEFDLRHSGERQRPDYEDAYLDWIFWWYLATLELTDRIVASQVDRS